MIVQRIDHLLILSSDPPALFSVFAETFGLPIAWTMQHYGSFQSGGVSVGNIDLEFLRLPDLPVETRLLGIAFEPGNLPDTLRELEQRGLDHAPPAPFVGTLPSGEQGTLWTNIILEGLLRDSMIFLCARAPYAQTRHERLTRELRERNGGALTILGAREIVVGIQDWASVQRWERLLGMPVADSLWEVGEEARIRIVPAARDGLLQLVLRVASLNTAAAALQAAGMLGDVNADTLIMASHTIQGLDIRLVEA